LANWCYGFAHEARRVPLWKPCRRFHDRRFFLVAGVLPGVGLLASRFEVPLRPCRVLPVPGRAFCCPPGGGAAGEVGGVVLHATATEPPMRDAVARPSSIRIASPYHHAARRALGRAVHASRTCAPRRRVPAKAVERRSRSDRKYEHRCPDKQGLTHRGRSSFLGGTSVNGCPLSACRGVAAIAGYGCLPLGSGPSVPAHPSGGGFLRRPRRVANLPVPARRFRFPKVQ
jgi:hypothetical protein